MALSAFVVAPTPVGKGTAASSPVRTDLQIEHVSYQKRYEVKRYHAHLGTKDVVNLVENSSV